MLSQKIPNLPTEFITPIADDAANAEEIFQKRFAHIEHLAEILSKQISEKETDTELSRIVLKHMEDPDADTSDVEDLTVGLVSMIYEGNLFVGGFSEEDYNIAHQMAEDYFNTEDETGLTQLQRSSELTAGMDIYSAAFILAQELINAVNARIHVPPLHTRLIGHNHTLN